jgi:hypothetical protein
MAARLRSLAIEGVLFLMPLLVWIALVRIQTGSAGLAEWFERYGSYRLAQLGPREDEVASLRAVERTVAAAPRPPIGKGSA